MHQRVATAKRKTGAGAPPQSPREGDTLSAQPQQPITAQPAGFAPPTVATDATIAAPPLSAPPPVAGTAVLYTAPSVPPGWYAEPGTGRQRYWNGHAWAEYAPPASAPASRGTNGMAVAALVLGLLWGYGIGSVLAIIFGAIGRKQTAERGQGGRGLATAGLVLGIIGVVIVALIILAAASTTSTGY
jgi:hypothetical protein